MKKYPLSLSSDYCSDWTPADAIREFAQNSLDHSSDFHYSYDEVSKELRLTNIGVTLPKETLLLGSTTKRDDNDSVGGYGEGYKIGMLVLCREGYDVVVENGNYCWTPVYEFSELYECDALVVQETEIQGDGNLTFIVCGVEQELMNTVTERCLYLQNDDDVGVVIETPTGRILRDKPGKLYVGGLYVSDIRMQCGYDFNPDQLKLNRDRKSVSDWDLSYATSQMWISARLHTEVADMLFNEVADVANMEYHKTADLEDACIEKFNEEYEGSFLAVDQDEKEEMEAKGVGNTVILPRTFTSIIRGSNNYHEPIVTESPKELTPIEEFDKIIEGWDDVSLCDIGAQEVFDSFYELNELFEEKGVRWE